MLRWATCIVDISDATGAMQKLRTSKTSTPLVSVMRQMRLERNTAFESFQLQREPARTSKTATEKKSRKRPAETHVEEDPDVRTRRFCARIVRSYMGNASWPSLEEARFSELALTALDDMASGGTISKEHLDMANDVITYCLPTNMPPPVYKALEKLRNANK